MGIGLLSQEQHLAREGSRIEQNFDKKRGRRMLVSPLDLPPSTALWNYVYNFYWFFGLISAVVVFAAMFYIIFKYRSKGGAGTPLEKQRENRETWKGPLIVIGLMAVVLVLVGSQTLEAFPTYQTVPNLGASPFGTCEISAINPSLSFSRVPNNGTNLNICVTGRQFFWSFTYPNNQTQTMLVVPVNRTTVLNVTSVDVYHQFGIPFFRTKTDAIPGRFNVVYIQPNTIANYTVQCFELCGVGHATMITTLVVLSQANFQKWYASTAGGG
jgi:cytochrome c oxidase subunit II